MNAQAVLKTIARIVGGIQVVQYRDRWMLAKVAIAPHEKLFTVMVFVNKKAKRIVFKITTQSIDWARDVHALKRPVPDVNALPLHHKGSQDCEMRYTLIVKDKGAELVAVLNVEHSSVLNEAILERVYNAVLEVVSMVKV